MFFNGSVSPFLQLVVAFVKWNGYSDDFNSWIPLKNLTDV